MQAVEHVPQQQEHEEQQAADPGHLQPGNFTPAMARNVSSSSSLRSHGSSSSLAGGEEPPPAKSAWQRWWSKKEAPLLLPVPMRQR